MTGALMQIASYGIENLYFTNDPQITFFKIVYKRHTNFSIESIPQFFNIQPDFSNKVSCILSKNADLINKIYVVVKLPNIYNLPSNIKIKWVEHLGYVLLKNIELEIGGHLIDKHYSDWLFIWNELNKNNNNRGNDIMIGNVKELNSFSNTKNSYQLYIPLQFWFCKNTALSLPIIALEHSEVKINIEFNDIDKCMIIGPTHYIFLSNTFCLFQPYELIQINNLNHYIIFIDFDEKTMKMGYIKTNNNLKLKINDILYGTTSFYETKIYNPNDNTFFNIKTNDELLNLTKSNTDFRNIYNLTLTEAFLYVDYIYLDNMERNKFMKSNHEYLIDICQFDNDKTVYNTNNKIKIGYSNPTKELIIKSQLNYMINNFYKDTFNYTTSINKNNSKSLIKKILIKLNGFNREIDFNKNFYTYIQSFQHHKSIPPLGLFLYSFSLNPSEFQPSGCINLSKIDDISIDVSLELISSDNTANVSIYAISNNIFQIVDGVGKLLFK
jgi:hypothetical protein